MGGVHECGYLVILLLIADRLLAIFIGLVGLTTLSGTFNDSWLRSGGSLAIALQRDDKNAVRRGDYSGVTRLLSDHPTTQRRARLGVTTRPRSGRLTTRSDDHLDAAKQLGGWVPAARPNRRRLGWWRSRRYRRRGPTRRQ